MPARSISTASLTFGLVSIPVRLFPATSSKSVSFHLLHAKDMSRIQQKIYCPKEEKIIDRSELVRGYEIEKDRYVTFTEEELKKLEAQADRAVEITEFIPATEVDPVYFENSYLLGCEPTSAKAYHLLEEAMTKAGSRRCREIHHARQGAGGADPSLRRRPDDAYDVLQRRDSIVRGNRSRCRGSGERNRNWRSRSGYSTI